jgi:hypothetical protein
MDTWLFILLFLIACALAFPLAIGVVVVFGFIATTWWRLTTPCPKCSARRMRFVNALKINFGSSHPDECDAPASQFYVCDACSTRWYVKWGQKEFHEAQGDDWDHYFNPACPEHGTQSNTP